MGNQLPMESGKARKKISAIFPFIGYDGKNSKNRLIVLGVSPLKSMGQIKKMFGY